MANALAEEKRISYPKLKLCSARADCLWITKPDSCVMLLTLVQNYLATVTLATMQGIKLTPGTHNPR